MCLFALWKNSVFKNDGLWSYFFISNFNPFSCITQTFEIQVFKLCKFTVRVELKTSIGWQRFCLMWSKIHSWRKMYVKKAEYFSLSVYIALTAGILDFIIHANINFISDWFLHHSPVCKKYHGLLAFSHHHYPSTYL